MELVRRNVTNKFPRNYLDIQLLKISMVNGSGRHLQRDRIQVLYCPLSDIKIRGLSVTLRRLSKSKVRPWPTLDCAQAWFFFAIPILL